MVTTKGQFKIQQMSFMLMAVVLLFILIAMFFVVYQSKSLKNLATESEKNKVVLMSKVISGSTEFSCVNKEFCIDTDKLIVLKNNSVYKEFWPVAYIKVRKIFPQSEDLTFTECNKANYPDCNLYNVYENKKIVSKSSIDSFVSLCRKDKVNEYLSEICELGQIEIGYEIK